MKTKYKVAFYTDLEKELIIEGSKLGMEGSTVYIFSETSTFIFVGDLTQCCVFEA